MGDAAYWDNWAGVFGPSASAFSRRTRAPGSNAAARIVDCTPRRPDSARAVQQEACETSVSKISPPPCRRPGGSLPPPGPPLAIFSVAEEWLANTLPLPSSLQELEMRY